ncbi:ParB/RepB/Spo0J family partition protein [Leptospira levettii]|uniref:ParB/RepB/Spo0J family partition protein n=1 Tax=Leptospira levettii TaxID=2023178 RepID=UPI00223E5149|nr:ParB/RepB/Spo0J family partition protein [Leptospira levettii]MCW7498442.1 ParB/RepB/Spo0J family partition protein [Leptospira levettii]
MSAKTKKSAMFESLGQNILVSNKESFNLHTSTMKNWELSPVRNANVSDLLDHPDNIKFFDYWDKSKREDELAWSRFVERIKKGGIHDPLIVFGPRAIAVGFSLKPNTLITGHRRKKALKELGITEAPVRFIEGKITLRELEVLMLSDNFDRRQIKDPAQVIYILVNLFPDTFQKDNRGGDITSKDNATLAEISKTHGISVPQLKRYKAVYREALRIAQSAKNNQPGPQEFKQALKNLANKRKMTTKENQRIDIKSQFEKKFPFLSLKLSKAEQSKLFHAIEKLVS